MTDQSSRKRPAPPLEAGPDDEGGDRMIGVDVGGRVFYTHLSTLTNAGGPYFEARFGGSFSPGGSPRRDEHGRDVYFIDGDGQLFGYILEYLRRGLASWPSFRDDPLLWRRLRAEADYFGIVSLAEALSVTYCCRPDTAKSIDKGVMFWLGTKKGTAEYRNPLLVDAVAFHKDLLRIGPAGVVEAQRLFLQYRPEVFNRDQCLAVEGDDMSFAFECTSGILACDDSFNGSSSVITLSDVSVRPTHYSLRFEHCYGMDSWNFEASVDGDKWDVLHKARGDPHLRTPSRQQQEKLRILLEDVCGMEKKRSNATAFVERELRHTWTLDPVPATFYSYFRFVGAGKAYFDALEDLSAENEEEQPKHSVCMHGVGFELFGDVHES